MNGVYAWIRDGVRRAVLLGFSDAVEQLGIPHNSEEMHPSLAALLAHSKTPQLMGTASAAERPTRKRLGRSLGDLANDESKE